MTGRLRKNHSASSRVAHTLDVVVTSIIATNNVASTTDLRCVPENLRAMSVEIGYLRRGLRWTKLSSRRGRWQRPRRGRTTRWMTQLSCTCLRTDCRPHPSKRELTGRPSREKTRQPPRPRRLKLRMTGLPDTMIRSPARLSHPVCLW